jgi:hypothetical protein
LETRYEYPPALISAATTTSAEIKNMWIYTSTPPYAFMALCLIS